MPLFASKCTVEFLLLGEEEIVNNIFWLGMFWFGDRGGLTVQYYQAWWDIFTVPQEELHRWWLVKMVTSISLRKEIDQYIFYVEL